MYLAYIIPDIVIITTTKSNMKCICVTRKSYSHFQSDLSYCHCHKS